MRKLWGCESQYSPVLIFNLLNQKRSDRDFKSPEVNEEDLYQFDPSELPGLSEFNTVDHVWNFFSKPKNIPTKNAVKRTKRTAGSGYWKITGPDRDVRNKNGDKIGRKKYLVFYKRNPGPSKDTKTNWVMHEFYVGDRPDFKENYVFCCIEKQPNKKPSVSSSSDGEPNSSLASVSVNHSEATFTEVENQQVQSHLLISDTGNNVTENTSTEVPPQPDSSQNLNSDSRNYVADFTSPMFPFQVAPQEPSNHFMVFDSTNYVAENINSTMMQSTPSDSFHYQTMVDLQLPLGQFLVSGSGNLGIENTFSMSGSSPFAEFGAFDVYSGLHHSSVCVPEMPINPEQVAPQVPSGRAMIFDSTNLVAENTCPIVKNMPYVSFQHQPMVDLPPLPSQNLVFGSGNHVPEYPCSLRGSSPPTEFVAFNGYNVKRPWTSTKNEDRRAKKPRIFFNDEGPSHNVACNDEIRNCVVEDTSPESQCDSISNINHVAENIPPELQPLPSCNSVSDSGQHVADAPEYTSQVDPLLLANSTVLSGCSALDQTFSSTLPPLAHPEKGSSYYMGSVLQVDPLLLANSTVLSGCSGLDQTFSSTLPPLAHPEKGSSYYMGSVLQLESSPPAITPGQGAYSFSYSNSFTKDYNMRSSHLDDEHEDVAKSQQDFQDGYILREEPDRLFPLAQMINPWIL